jgi:hypothetical protein
VASRAHATLARFIRRCQRRYSLVELWPPLATARLLAPAGDRQVLARRIGRAPPRLAPWD